VYEWNGSGWDQLNTVCVTDIATDSAAQTIKAIGCDKSAMAFPFTKGSAATPYSGAAGYAISASAGGGFS